VIKAKTGDVLLFSFIGMKSVSKVVVVNTINVSMQGGESLSRSGSLGYGKQPQKQKL
jgi:hypothetical protein